jgi:hypothetical protein
MLLINATILNRKSGGAKWRDLPFSGPFLEMFSTERSQISYFAPFNAAGFKQSSRALRYPAKMIQRNDWETPWRR